MTFLTKVLDQVLQTMNVTAKCETCGILFIDVPYKEFLKLHSWEPDNPDKWFVEACLHVCNNPDHKVSSTLPDSIEYQRTGKITESTINKLLEDKTNEQGITPEEMKEHLLKLYEEVKTKQF